MKTIIGVIVGAVLGLILTPIGNMINEGPDFSISIEDPLIVTEVLGHQSRDVIFYNDNKIIGLGYNHSISLVALDKDNEPLSEGVNIEFSKPILSFLGNDTTNSTMTVHVNNTNFKYNKENLITVLAIGADGKIKSCSFILRIRNPEKDVKE
jgi:hypothetical protein